MTSYPLRNGYQDDWTWNVQNKEQEVKISDEDPDRAIFHMPCEGPMTGIRGTHQLKCRKHYWEITFQNTNSSNHVFLGVGNLQAAMLKKCCSFPCTCSTKHWNVVRDQRPAVGKDACSYNGDFICCIADQERTIGILLDNEKETLTYYEDGTQLRFFHLGKVRNATEGLFPIIVACEFTQITLGIRLVDIFTLQDRCRETIVSTISKKADIDQLPIPTKIKEYLKDHDEVEMSRYT